MRLSIAIIFQKEHLKIAQQFFQLVGKAAGECGRQSGNKIENLMVKSC